MARRVLVADDSPTIQRRAKDTLAAEGIDVVTVSNGVAAIKKLRDVNPLVVLADVSMPGKDGYEVCDFVKSTPEWRHVPVLLVVGADEPYDEPRSVRVGADGRIKKPFDRDELVSTVTKFLSQAEKAAPPPPAPAPAQPPTMVTEPVDEAPELHEKKRMAVGALPEGMAFGEPVPEVPSDFPPVIPSPAPAIPEEEAAVAPAPEGFDQPPFPAETPPPAEPFIPATEPVLAAPPPEDIPVPAEPVLVEDVAEDAPSAPTPPPMEGTMMFRSPTQIAEPVLSDEVSPEPELAAAETSPPPPPSPPPEIAIPTTTLDSFSLTDAARGNVRFAPQQPSSTPGHAAPALDANTIQSIVHRVVVKMSPPALSPEVIEQMARKFAEEIIAEMGTGTAHTS